MRFGLAACVVLALCGFAVAQAAPAASAPGVMPFLQVDAKAREVRVECESLNCGNPLEFFLCSAGTNEHEAVLRSKVKPSHLHAALLMTGLKPGEPVHFSEATKTWLPPHGPPLQLSVEFQKDGKTVALPAYRLMREMKSKREMPPTTWIFAGSRVMENGVYAADQTGYLVSVVNFDLTVIDIPRLASNANETLEWETNTALVPKAGTKVTLVITPAGAEAAPVANDAAESHASDAAKAPIDEPMVKIDVQGHIKLDDTPVESADALIARLGKRQPPAKRVRLAIANSIEDNPAAREVMNALSRNDIRFLTIPQAESATSRPSASNSDDAMIDRLKKKWEQAVVPHDQAVRDAAKTHYAVIAELRSEQQKLIDEADKIQRLIDTLEKRYQDMTTPQPQ